MPDCLGVVDAGHNGGHPLAKHVLKASGDFWHLGTDKQGELWQRVGPQSLLLRPAGATPTLGELRQEGVQAGFAPDIFDALRQTPGLLQDLARRVLDAYFPETLQADIAAVIGLDLGSCQDPAGHELV